MAYMRSNIIIGGSMTISILLWGVYDDIDIIIIGGIVVVVVVWCI